MPKVTSPKSRAHSKTKKAAPRITSHAKAKTGKKVSALDIQVQADVAAQKAVEVSRRALRSQVAKDRRDRLSNYKKSLTAPIASRRAGVVAASRVEPLRVLAEGDSWFDYPLEGGAIPKRLIESTDMKLLNYAHRGDEVRQMLGVAQRVRLEKSLADSSLRFEAPTSAISSSILTAGFKRGETRLYIGCFRRLSRHKALGDNPSEIIAQYRPVFSAGRLMLMFRLPPAVRKGVSERPCGNGGRR